jgi:sulfhydrogenase subunit beta (sulfur reductase)
MGAVADRSTRRAVLDLALLQRLLDAVGAAREVSGPRVLDGVIGWGPVASVDDLPVGAHDEQSPGRYRLVVDPAGDDLSRFGWAVGPQTVKPLLHPPLTDVWSITRDTDGFHVTMAAHPVVARALFGVRPCEAVAMRTLEHVLVDGRHPDPTASANAADRIVVAVDCTRPASTCFCASMGSGPACPDDGADIALTELADPDGSNVRYLARSLTERGADLIDSLGAPAAQESDLAAGRAALDHATDSQVRHVDRDGIRAVLRDGAELTAWEDVADRCLTCGNCTAVCPTCFCTDVHDTTTLDGSSALRTRHWDSCFSLQFSRIAGHPVRTTVRSRYRQWLTHKLGTWWDQFGETGCVGCGRCITWCPVGIDLTVEAGALAAEAAAAAAAEGPGAP